MLAACERVADQRVGAVSEGPMMIDEGQRKIAVPMLDDTAVADARFEAILVP